MIDGSLFLSNVSSRFFPVLVSIFYVPRVRPLVKSPSLLCLAFFAKRFHSLAVPNVPAHAARVCLSFCHRGYL
jgi:hypothetical protein